MPTDCREKYCIIGAGSSGLAALKHFLAAGIPCDCLEREADLGGNWNFGQAASSVAASTHLVSSKKLTEYRDFPMPEDWPEYPSHRQALEYFRAYARRFDLERHIQFGAVVERIELTQQGAASAEPFGPAPWLVRLATGEERHYRGVVIANGHNWDPRWPDYPGEFTGEQIHSRQYKTHDILFGKRVLVVGGGNSGCDVACEAAQHASAAFLSTRRAYHVLPKFFRGNPIDQCHEFLLHCRVPLWARRAMNAVAAHITLGPSYRTGVPRPDHRLFESHPIINSQLHHHVGHGRLQLRGEIDRFAGDRVHFVDGREEQIDLVIFATGYRVTFPFIDQELLNWQADAPRLWLNVFHPHRDDLFCIGLIQPDSGQWGLVDDQSRMVASYLKALRDAPRRAAALQRQKETADSQLSGDSASALSNGVRYLPTPRHALEVEHFSYRKKMQRVIRQLR